MASLAGERLKHFRKLRKMSQEELAGMLKVPPNTISKMEHGSRKVTLDEAVQIAEILEVSLLELAGVPEPAHVRSEASRSMQKMREAMFELERSFSLAHATS